MDDLERQLDELTAIQSLYEGAVTVDTSDEHIAQLQAMVEKGDSSQLPHTQPIRFTLRRTTEPNAMEFTFTFHFPPQYPSTRPPEVSFRCDGISRTGSDAVKAAIASHLQQCAGEAVMSLVEDITHHMIELSTRMATAHAQQQVLAHGQADDAPRMLYKRCTFLCDHMLSGRQHKKESKVRDVCEGLGLTGALFYGKPSVVIVEGSESEIEQFVREAGRQGKAMKKRKTQSLVVGNADRRYQKFVLVQAIGKTDTLDTGTLKEHLEDLGIGAKFKHIIGVEELQ